MIIKKLQEELDKNEEYKDLLLERKEILRSNGFINKLQPRFEAICERLQEIDNETQKKLWGEVVLKDSEDEDIDFSFRDTSENVFQEALKTYCYTVEELFCCGYARYFWEAIKIRYPEYCFYVDWEDMYAEN